MRQLPALDCPSMWSRTVAWGLRRSRGLGGLLPAPPPSLGELVAVELPKRDSIAAGHNRIKSLPQITHRHHLPQLPTVTNNALFTHGSPRQKALRNRLTCHRRQLRTRCSSRFEGVGTDYIRSVDNVNSSGFGPRSTGSGSARFPCVFQSFQCLQGLECSSSPTSGTAFPLVRGVFALTCIHSPDWVPLMLVAACCLAAAVACEVVWVAGSGPWLAGPPPAGVWSHSGLLSGWLCRA